MAGPLDAVRAAVSGGLPVDSRRTMQLDDPAIAAIEIDPTMRVKHGAGGNQYRYQTNPGEQKRIAMEFIRKNGLQPTQQNLANVIAHLSGVEQSSAGSATHADGQIAGGENVTAAPAVQSPPQSVPQSDVPQSDQPMYGIPSTMGDDPATMPLYEDGMNPLQAAVDNAPAQPAPQPPAAPQEVVGDPATDAIDDPMSAEPVIDRTADVATHIARRDEIQAILDSQNTSTSPLPDAEIAKLHDERVQLDRLIRSLNAGGRPARPDEAMANPASQDIPADNSGGMSAGEVATGGGILATLLGLGAVSARMARGGKGGPDTNLHLPSAQDAKQFRTTRNTEAPDVPEFRTTQSTAPEFNSTRAAPEFQSPTAAAARQADDVDLGPEFRSTRSSVGDFQRVDDATARSIVDPSIQPESLPNYPGIFAMATKDGGRILRNAATGEAIVIPPNVVAGAMRDPQGLEQMLRIALESLR